MSKQQASSKPDKAAPAAATEADAPRAPAAAAADNAASAAAADADNAGPLQLEDIVAPLAALPEDERPYAAARFADFAGLLKRVQIALLTRDAANERLQDQDCLLLTYLAAYYNGVAASPAVLNGDLLERALVASGVVLPFAGPSQTGGAAAFGVPSNVTPDVLCDSISELARMAVAALLALYVYLNFRRGPADLPSDEAVLVFATIAINSTADAANAARLDVEMGALAAPGSIRCAQVRWLMHFVRQLVMGHMGAVCHANGDARKHAECRVAAQFDHRGMVKALPESAYGYVLWARSALGLRQAGVAAAIAERGLAAAKAARDDVSEAALSYLLAVAKVLGGGCAEGGKGSSTSSGEDGGKGGDDKAAAAAGVGEEGEAAAAAAAAPATFDVDEVLELQAAGAAAAASVGRWWPRAWAAQRPAGEPDRTALADKLLPMVEERAGGARAVAGAGRMPCLADVAYMTRPPASVPPGAIQEVPAGEGEEEQEGEGLDTVPEVPQV